MTAWLPLPVAPYSVVGRVCVMHSVIRCVDATVWPVFQELQIVRPCGRAAVVDLALSALSLNSRDVEQTLVTFVNFRAWLVKLV